MLDTNMASYVLKRTYPSVEAQLQSVPMTSVCLSVITEAELLFGVAKKAGAHKLATLVHEFLLCLDVLPWDRAAARCYADIRNVQEGQGRPLGAMDMLIAAHAVAIDAVLVTHDQAFRSVDGLALADWTQA
jgi:tRNA(fMet)-specific endonuclease VapC